MKIALSPTGRRPAASVMYTRVCIVVIARVVPEYRPALGGCRHPLALQQPSLAVGAAGGSVRESREKGRRSDDASPASLVVPPL